MILNGNEIIEPEMTKGSQGGTEYMGRRIASSIDPSLLESFQIVFSRGNKEDLDPNKIRIFYAHDLPQDAAELLKNGGWKQFHKLTFVSNWQMEKFIMAFGIPYSKCIIMRNAIDPLPEVEKYDDGKIHIIHHCAPHKALELLVPVFEKIAEQYDDVVLDLYSSFKLYNWLERDKQYEALYTRARENPSINYHGVVSNEEVRLAVAKSHIFALPSIFPETSCIALMEAMSGRCVCVHNNFGATFETASNFTYMYQFSENIQEHASIFHSCLCAAIDTVKSPSENDKTSLQMQKLVADSFYNWGNRKLQWEQLLQVMKQDVKDTSFAKETFVYSSM